MSVAIHKYYSVTEEGTLKRERQTCPRCGTGVFLANHKNRHSCGKCGYAEFKKTKKE